jgi:hypothetical protein
VHGGRLNTGGNNMREWKRGDKVRVKGEYYHRDYGRLSDAWKETNDRTIFNVVRGQEGGGVDLNCPIFEKYFGNNQGLSIATGYVVSVNPFNCKHQCKDCADKCGLWESE